MGKVWRLATFNLENLADTDCDVDSFSVRLLVLRPQLLRLRADILCLQEVGARRLAGKHGPRAATALEHLLQGTPYEKFHQVISQGQSGTHPADHHNLVIASRFPILSHDQVWHHLVPPPVLSSCPGDDAPRTVEWDRPILRADLDIGRGRVLRLVNVHLRAPRAAHLAGQKDADGGWRSVSAWAEGYYHAAIKQAGQALEARRLVESLMDGDPAALVAVCGDFNADEHEAPLRILRADEEETGNGLLAPRTLVPVERGIDESRRFSVLHHGRRVLLDHILVSRPLLGWLRGCAIHNETLGDELVGSAVVRDPPDSFHAPMVAEFG